MLDVQWIAYWQQAASTLAWQDQTVAASLHPLSSHQAVDLEPYVLSLPAVRPHLSSSWQLMAATTQVWVLMCVGNWICVIVLAATGLNHICYVIVEEPADAKVWSVDEGIGCNQSRPWGHNSFELWMAATKAVSLTRGRT